MSITRDGCQWIEDGDDGPWATKCGHYFEVAEGTPTENDFKFCCFCGRPLIEMPNQDGDDD